MALEGWAAGRLLPTRMAGSNAPEVGFGGPKSTGHSTEKSEQPTKYTKHTKNEALTKAEGRESNIAGHKNVRNVRKPSSASLGSGRTGLDQPRPVGFQVQYHAVDPAHLGPSHLAQIPQHLVMDQHFPKLHDLNVALCRSPELPLGQGRCGLLPRCVHVQLSLYPLAKVVPSLPHPDESAKSAQESYRRKPRNCRITNTIGGYFG